MHSGFHALRNALPMNIRARRYVELNPAVQQDIARIDSIWSQQMTEFTPSKNQGTWLFGEWSIADMMFAPVVMRFFTYEIEVSQASRAYMGFYLIAHQASKQLVCADGVINGHLQHTP